MPEIGRVDAAVFDVGQGRFYGMNIVDGKQTRYVQLPGYGGDQARHPVMTVNQVRPDPGDDVVDHFTLKGQGDLGVLAAVVGIYPVQVKKGPVFRQMDSVIGHDPAQRTVLFSQKVRQPVLKDRSIIRQGHMDIGPLMKQGTDQGGGTHRPDRRLWR